MNIKREENKQFNAIIFHMSKEPVYKQYIYQSVKHTRIINLIISRIYNFYLQLFHHKILKIPESPGI